MSSTKWDLGKIFFTMPHSARVKMLAARLLLASTRVRTVAVGSVAAAYMLSA